MGNPSAGPYGTKIGWDYPHKYHHPGCIIWFQDALKPSTGRPCLYVLNPSSDSPCIGHHLEGHDHERVMKLDLILEKKSSWSLQGRPPTSNKWGYHPMYNLLVAHLLPTHQHLSKGDFVWTLGRGVTQSKSGTPYYHIIHSAPLPPSTIQIIKRSLPGWWLNQPVWKIWSSKWVHLPQFSRWKKNIWVATT